MINFIIPLIGRYLMSDLVGFFFFPMICLGVLYVFPSFVRSLCSWR